MASTILFLECQVDLYVQSKHTFVFDLLESVPFTSIAYKIS